MATHLNNSNPHSANARFQDKNASIHQTLVYLRYTFSMSQDISYMEFYILCDLVRDENFISYCKENRAGQDLVSLYLIYFDAHNL
jgi:hypothetical protein